MTDFLSKIFASSCFCGQLFMLTLLSEKKVKRPSLYFVRHCQSNKSKWLINLISTDYFILLKIKVNVLQTLIQNMSCNTAYCN